MSGQPAPITFAHRGASGYRPENTLPAFRLALEQGAAGLESDVWLGRAGEPILVHDRTIRLPGRRIDVTRRPLEELAALGIPRLADVWLTLGTDFELSLDIEHPQVAGPMLEVAVAFGAADRLWACHEDLDLLSGLRARSEVVRLVWSTRPRRVPGDRAGIAGLLGEAADRRIDALNLHWRDWDASLVNTTHGAGLRAFGWDAQTTAAVDRLVELGIDGLYADHPDLLVARVDAAVTRARHASARFG